MRDGIVLAAVAMALAGMAGCAPARLHYELRPPVLAPPQQPATATPRQVRLRLADAPACRALASSYDGTAFGLSWTLEPRHLQIVTNPRLSGFTQSLPVELLRGIQQLHTLLDRAVGDGCLSPAAEHGALRRIAEGAPLAPDVAQVAVLGPYTVQAYIDVGDPVRLHLTYGLLPNQPGRYDLGYVAREYRLVVDTNDGRGHLELAQTAVFNARAPRVVPPAPVELASSVARFYRLFFFLRVSASNHGVALLGADTRAKLDEASHAVLLEPRRCLTLSWPGVSCALVEPPVGLDAGLRVWVQGRPVVAALPGTVRQALEAAGIYDASRMLSTLRVERPWRGRLIPVTAISPHVLLGLLLLGGERIRY